MRAAGLEARAVDGGFRAEAAEVAVERLLGDFADGRLRSSSPTI